MDGDVRVIIMTIAVVIFVTIFMHDRHYQSRGTRILENRVRMLEEIVSEWTN